MAKNIKKQQGMIKNEVLEKFGAKKFSEASELVVDYILENNYIYTTRDDIKPEVWIYNHGIYIPEGRSAIKEILREIMGEAYSNFLFKMVMDKIEIDTFINSREFFNHNYLYEIPIQNGILNIITKEIKEFTPEMIFFNKLPIVYDSTKDCPAIKKFFRDVLKDEEDIKVMFEIIGFCLLKEYSFEKAFMFVGSGRNGKSKTLSLIKRFLGLENCSGVPLSQLKPDSSSICELHNRLVNLAGDLSNVDLKETGLFKQLTGRDLINAKRKFLRDMIFENYAKLIFACNELPRVYDTSKGFWSRWILLEFPYEFVTQLEYDNTLEKVNKKIENPDIIEQIATSDEMSGLLNDSLKGLDRLLKNKRFSYSRGTAEIKDTWIRMSNPFMAFCLDCLEDDAENMISKRDLRLIFNKYCKFYGVKGTSDRDIKATLEDLFGVVEEEKKLPNEERIRFWIGIKPKLHIIHTYFPNVSSYIYIPTFSKKAVYNEYPNSNDYNKIKDKFL